MLPENQRQRRRQLCQRLQHMELEVFDVATIDHMHFPGYQFSVCRMVDISTMQQHVLVCSPQTDLSFTSGVC